MEVNLEMMEEEEKQDNGRVGLEKLVERLAAKGYTKVACKLIWKDVFQTLEEVLVDGNEIMINGFGKFVVRQLAERWVEHPATRERVLIPSHKTVRFLPSEKLRRELDEGFIRG